MQKSIIDIGSSTLKLYNYDGSSLNNTKQKSIHFKKNLQDGKISKDDLKELESFISDANIPPQDLRLYATSFFRKLDGDVQERTIEYIFLKTGHLINIIDQTSENIFLQLALTRNLKSTDTFLIINVGGGSTELVVIKNGKKKESINIDIGVVNIMKDWKGINDEVSMIELKEVVEAVKAKLSHVTEEIDYAFQTGGELTYMQIAQYKLTDNTLFKDENHPSIIDMTSYTDRNEEVFSKVSLAELEALMPDNPQWMHGARPYSAIAQAICEHYGIQTIIPSDVNIAHGIAHYLWGY